MRKFSLLHAVVFVSFLGTTTSVNSSGTPTAKPLDAIYLDCIKKPDPKKFTARVTFYNGRDDEYGKETATGTVQSEHAKTAAANLNFLPSGTVIKIRDLEEELGNDTFRVIDTGTDVIRRRAAKNMAKHLFRNKKITREEFEKLKECPVIDIFVDVSEQKLEKIANNVPYFMEVEVTESTT